MKNKSKGVIKKAIALMIGTALTLGAMMLPGSVVNNTFTTASAHTYEENGCTYTYKIETDRNVSTFIISEVSGYGETIEMPTAIVHEGKKYNVDKIDPSFLSGDTIVKKIIFPKRLKYIGHSVLKNSSVESITLPDTLEDVDSDFAANCINLKEVNYTGTKIKGGNLGIGVLNSEQDSPLYNEKGALCFGNWLLDYNPPKEVTSVRIADLGNNGIKIENIASYATKYNEYIETIDLEGIKHIDNGTFNRYERLSILLNDEDVDWVAEYCFHYTPWYDKAKNDELVKIGNTIIYYKTDENILDLTEGKFADTKHVCGEALDDSGNIDTILCNSDCSFDSDCLHVENKRQSGGSYREDPLPEEPVFNIKNIYVDGKKLTYDLLLENTDVYEWFKANITTFDGSVLTRTMVEEKTKELFDELDITYYGENNDVAGTLTPTEEFYIRMKIHDYLSLYDYDHHHIYHGFVGAFLLGGRVTCTQYAELAQYFLECAGVGSKTNFSDPEDSVSYDVHFWNATKIGDEWFVSDDGWNAQNNNHSYGWFMNSYTAFNTSVFHEYMYMYDSFHVTSQYLSSETITADRFLGDINGDDKRDNDDVEILWNYIKGNSSTINRHKADINFDDIVDVTDAVLLDHFVNGKAVDISNIPIDGLAPTVQVAFLNGEDYDEIKYLYTERGGYITLPDGLFKAPEGKKLSYDVGMVGQKVRITDPCTVVSVKWIDADTPDYSEPESSVPQSSIRPESSLPEESSIPEEEKIRLGDVNNDRTIDIEDAVAIIQHINGMTPLKADEEKRADVSKDGSIEIDDAVMIISYINGSSTL